MSHVSYTDLRQNLAKVLDEAIDSRAPITVTRQGKRDVVLLAADEYAGLEETIHLLRSPNNARRLFRSIRAAEAGTVTEGELAAVEDDAPA